MYSVHHITNDVRMIELPVSASLRYRFNRFDNKTRIKFKKEGSKLVAFVRGKIVVYKKPRATQYHYQLMQANRGALSRGECGADADRLLENMLECVEVI